MGYWGKNVEDDRQALVVYAVYKSKMTGSSMQEDKGWNPTRGYARRVKSPRSKTDKTLVEPFSKVSL